jgi:endonuclease YncB( thermonuclease family)
MDTENWEQITYADTVPFIPPITIGKVVKIYDGDTITIAGRIPGQSTLYRFSVRLAGIDCPEMKSKTVSEKEMAQEAKAFVVSRIMGAVVKLQHVEMEKYGRLLARVLYVDASGTEMCINDQLCEQRLAVSYDGGTKICPTNWREYYDLNLL